MTMHKAIHHRVDMDRLYASRKEGGRGPARIEDSVDVSIKQLEDYIEKRGEGLDYSYQKRYRQHEDQQNDNN